MTDTTMAPRSKCGRSGTALIAFVPAAFPDPGRFEDACRACVSAGADILEIGLCADPPQMEGEVIRHAFSDAARFSWETRVACLSRAAAVAPVIGMTHDTDPTRVDAFIKDCSRAGAGHVLFPSLPVGRQLHLAARASIGVGVFVSSRKDLDEVAAAAVSPSFVYVRSSGRSTGDPLDAERAADRIRDVRRALEHSGVPVVVGFGIESAEQVAELSSLGVGGVVVGTAVVRAAAGGQEQLEYVVGELADAARRAAAS